MSMNTVLMIFVLLACFRRTVFLVLSIPFTRVAYRSKNRRKGQTAPVKRSFLDKVSDKYASMFEHLIIYYVAMVPSHWMRMFYYRRVFLMDIAEHVVIYAGVEMRCVERISIGQGSIIGSNSILDGREGLFIGENVNFSSNVSVWTMQHDYRDKDFGCTPEHVGPVFIGDRVWIGPNSTILPGRKISGGAVVAAGAVVTKDVAEYTVVGGVPAKKITDRPGGMDYVFNGQSRLFL